MDVDRAMNELARQQHGVVSRGQLRDLGASKATIRHRSDGPNWERSGLRTLRASGSPDTDRQTLMIAVLEMAPRAYLSHQSAAALWGLPGFELLPPRLTIARTRSRRPSGTYETHWTTTVRDELVTELDGLPILRPARVMLDLAACLPKARVARALDAAWASRILDIADIDEMLGLVARQGRDGVVVLRALASKRRGLVRPESGLEARFHQIIDQAGLPPFDRQVELYDDQGLIGRVDAVDRDARLIVELDSARYHTALTDRESDQRRDRRLTAAGYRVCRFTDTDVFHRSRWVVSECERLRRDGFERFA